MAPTEPPAGSSRILALDGGGVRGMLTLQYLRAIEATLRDRYGRPDLCLHEYFDLIGGTSTGAIIAAGLALGKSVDEIEDLYVHLARRIFSKPWYAIGAVGPKFGHGALVGALQDAFGADTTLGSNRLRTGLLVVAKRMDTGSSWVVTNCPRDPYFQPVAGKKRVGNCNMLLWQVVRASTAAPHYFKPEALVIGSWLDPTTGRSVSDSGEFIDGGVTPFNNPALQCLRAALIPAYGFNFSAGEDSLLLVSVGTGLRRRGAGKATGIRRVAGIYAVNALLGLMDDCNTDVELTLQWLSRSDTARRIDGLVGTLEGHAPFGRRLLTYQRYNLRFEQRQFAESLPRMLPAGLADELATRFATDWPQPVLDRLARMDKPGNMPALKALGTLVSRVVQPAHFPAVFDPLPVATR
jgi:predicted acylesterase/phospholipase RssA